MRTETQRVVALPVREQTRTQIGPRLARSPSAPLLRAAQEEALGVLAQSVAAGHGPWGPRGMAGLIGCGHGKTLIAQLAPAVAGSSRPLLLIPAALSPQLDRDVREWRDYYPVQDPPRLSYEQLSSPRSATVLDRLRPDLLILDEAHKLANPQSARWRRVARYIQANPSTRVVVLSGTMSWKELGQMRHLLLAALRDWTPLPGDRTLDHWASILDVGGEPGADAWRVFSPVLAWAGETRKNKATARSAFKARLATCPGVVLTAGVAADVSIRMRRWVPGPAPSKRHQAALDLLEQAWELPDGTQLVDTLEHSRHRRTLALGFYNRWAPDQVDPSWVEARKIWGRAVRKGTAYLGYDSPALVCRAAEQGRLPPGMMAAWRRWLPFRSRAVPETEAVWVDLDWAPNTVQAYLDEVQGTALVWVQSRALGARLHHAGLPYHGQGSRPPEKGSAAVSMHVHGTGWNGQHYHRQLILEPPSSASTWEQLLARTHRVGQREDVSAWVLSAFPTQRVALEVGLAGARYVHDSQGIPQRLLLADWIP